MKMTTMMTNSPEEVLFNQVAKQHMIQFDAAAFKRTYPTLLKTIVRAMIANQKKHEDSKVPD